MVKGSETERRGGGNRGEGERARPGEMKSRPAEERKKREMQGDGQRGTRRA